MNAITGDIAVKGGAMLDSAKRVTANAGAGVDWDAVIADPRFQALHRKKTSFLWGLMAFSVAFYFLLPIGAAYFQGLFRIQVWGPVNVGLLFALAEFVVAWGVAVFYSRRANAEFDTLAKEIADDYARRAGA